MATAPSLINRRLHRKSSRAANHIIAARNEFASAFGDLARGKRNWQLTAFALVGLLAMVTLAYVRLAASSRVVPYVVEVDRLGQIVAVGTADQMRAPDQRLVASQLAQFLRAIRTVLPAAASAAQAKMVRRGYAFVAPEAAAFLNDSAFDPFGLAGSADVLATYNPLDLIDPESPEAVDDARTLADMIVLSEGREGEQAFWNEEARSVLTGLILHVATSAPTDLRTLSHVRTLLTLAPGPFAELLKEMQASDAAGGLVARAAARLLSESGEGALGSHLNRRATPTLSTVRAWRAYSEARASTSRC